MIVIGIDTGVKTGFAVWDTVRQHFEVVKTTLIFLALQETIKIKPDLVIVEDARKRKWFGKKNASYKSQGAGSVKRDAKIWEETLNLYKIPFILVDPLKNNTKVDSEYFKKLTRYTKRTSNHARDASMLVFGLKTQTVKRLLINNVIH